MFIANSNRCAVGSHRRCITFPAISCHRQPSGLGQHDSAFGICFSAQADRVRPNNDTVRLLLKAFAGTGDEMLVRDILRSIMGRRVAPVLTVKEANTIIANRCGECFGA
jgi:hypothetical protein